MKMKSFVKVAGLCILLMAFVTLTGTPTTKAASEEEIEASIVAGLAWLASQQNADGSWGFSVCDKVAYTGLAVLKFETRARELDMDPLDPEYEYYAQVSNGLDYIVANANNQAIGVQPAGDPDGDGDGIGTWFGPCSQHSVYNTGIAMMAIAASGHPELYGDILQDAVDWMAWAQADVDCGVHRGGWRYWADCDSDNSNSGYATLGLGFAEYPPPCGVGNGIAVPQFVKDELSIWIDVIQDDVNGDTNDGGSHYIPYGGWVNILKTGNLLYEMALVGDTIDTQRVTDAIDYIERHWNDAGGCGTGWVNHRQAMFTMMKGFESLGIELIDLDGDGAAETDWFDVVSTHLVSTQDADGGWPTDCWGDRILSTAWALLTLEKAVCEFLVPVPFDIKPGSCPNPVNVKSKGVLPAAIMGTEDFDVSQIDPASLLLRLKDAEEPVVEVAPLRWAIADVGEPFEPFIGKVDCYDDCAGCSCPDGYLDLVFHFDTQEVVAALVAALGELYDEECLVLEIIGNLMDDNGGTPIVGEDVVRILKKGKK
jgi:hypothetical protein